MIIPWLCRGDSGDPGVLFNSRTCVLALIPTTLQELRMLSSVTLNCQVRGQKVKGLVVIYKGRYRAVSDSRLDSG